MLQVDEKKLFCLHPSGSEGGATVSTVSTVSTSSSNLSLPTPPNNNTKLYCPALQSTGGRCGQTYGQYNCNNQTINQSLNQSMNQSLSCSGGHLYQECVQPWPAEGRVGNFSSQERIAAGGDNFSSREQSLAGVDSDSSRGVYSPNLSRDEGSEQHLRSRLNPTESEPRSRLNPTEQELRSRLNPTEPQLRSFNHPQLHCGHPGAHPSLHSSLYKGLHPGLHPGQVQGYSQDRSDVHSHHQNRLENHDYPQHLSEVRIHPSLEAPSVGANENHPQGRLEDQHGPLEVRPRSTDLGRYCCDTAYTCQTLAERFRCIRHSSPNLEENRRLDYRSVHPANLSQPSGPSSRDRFYPNQCSDLPNAGYPSYPSYPHLTSDQPSPSYPSYPIQPSNQPNPSYPSYPHLTSEQPNLSSLSYPIQSSDQPNPSYPSHSIQSTKGSFQGGSRNYF